jgi:hypothetical protein
LLPGFAPLIVDLFKGVESGARGMPASGEWDGLLTALDGWSRRVIENDDERARLIRLLVADQELDRLEVRWCLGYLHSHLVNKYQGTIAEFLAVRVLSIWLSEEIAADRLGADILLVPGDEILERRSAAGRSRWDRGADGLLLLDSGDEGELSVVGIVEVKSFPTTYVSVHRQIERHSARLRRGGLRIGDRHWSPERLRAAWWDRRRGWQAGVKNEDWAKVLRILVSARPRSLRPTTAPSPPHHNLQLPASKALLAATAYELTVRFLEKLGREAFRAGSPWPEMTAEEAAANAVKQALYHIIREQRAYEPTFAGIARRLYNVYGFGYSRAEGHRDMLWADGRGGLIGSDKPSPEPPTEPSACATLEALVDGAWAHYRRARLETAEGWARAALASNPHGGTRRRIAWLRGMIRFYQADFVGACDVLPDPGDKPTPDDGWWAKNMLTLVRARTRSGSGDVARDLIERLERGGSKWSHLGVALPTSRGWVALDLGNAAEADRLADRALQELASLRADAADRNRRGLGDPLWHDVGAIQAAVVDLAALISVRGRAEQALALLEPMEGLFPPLLKLIALDPAFAPLRNAAELRRRLEVWLDRRTDQ